MKPIKRLRAIWLIISLSSLILIVGCHSHQSPTRIEASAFVVDDGVVRIWRKDINKQPSTIIVAYSPYNSTRYSQLSRFSFIDGSLSQLVTTIESQPKVIESLRFDDKGNVTFNQRQLNDRREQISEKYIELMQYATKQTILISNALIHQQVKLYQGQYIKGVVTTCQGANVSLSLNKNQAEWLNTRTLNRKKKWLAWIESPYGRQLLLIGDEDFCFWQPTYDQM